MQMEHEKCLEIMFHWDAQNEPNLLPSHIAVPALPHTNLLQNCPCPLASDHLLPVNPAVSLAILSKVEERSDHHRLGKQNDRS